MNRLKSFKTIWFCYKEVFSSHPVLSFIEGISYLGNSLVAGLMPLAWKWLFDAVGNLLQNGSSQGLFKAFMGFAVFQLLEVLCRLLGRISPRVFSYDEKVIQTLREKLYSHAAAIPLECFDDARIYNAYFRANSAIGKKAATNMMNQLYQTPALIFSIVVMTVTVWTFSPYLVLAAVASILPASVVHISRAKKHHDMQQGQAPEQRSRAYFWSLFLKPASIREIRTYGCESFMREKWENAVARINGEEMSFFRQNLKRQFPADAFRVIGYGFGIVFSAFLMGIGTISIGAFGAVINAFGSLQQTYNVFLSNLGAFREACLFFYDYIDFMNVKPAKKGSRLMPGNTGRLELSGVSFKYPNADKQALRNINLTIEPDEHIAVVGENGSGKTTLCKVLCGLYAPSSGAVKLEGTDISEYSGGFYSKCSAVYQDYVKYLLSIRENVALGNIEELWNNDRIREAMDKAGILDIVNGELGLDSRIGREFGGCELSGGQWQKLAIARGYFRDSSFIVFDEPTAALDPIIESEIFKSFLNATGKCTSVLVTHRIGSARLADRIIVMKAGEIVEDGDHRSLLEMGGEYADMYRMQAKWYE